MSEDLNFDVIVVGRGLIASASARHLALEGRTVGLIGPTEKQNLRSGQVYASHYDNTRVQRIVAQNELWTRLNLDSARQWNPLQELTGIDFYRESGCIYVNTFHDGYLETAPKIADKFGLKMQSIRNREDVGAISPFLYFDQEVEGIYEPHLAGSINPRKLVEAQLRAFQQLGGTEVNEIVVDLSRSDGEWHATTSSGERYSAKQVLVAAGAFSNYFNLLPRKLDIQNKSEVVVMAKVTEADFLRMRDMPSLLFEIKVGEFDGIYLIAPTQTSDGSYILKMGMNQSRDLDLNDEAAMRDWFTGDAYLTYASVLERELKKLFPTIHFVELTYKPCVISRTTTENPYIGEVEEDLFVAHGCNGYSAMSSDAQGRQATALMLNGRFDEGYNADDFRVIYK